MANAEDDNGKGGGAAAGASRGEWVVAALGGLVTLATIGYVLYEGFTEPPSPVPDVEVVVDTVLRQRGGWLVRLEASNRGDATAASVRVSGELRADSGVVESSETVFEYVPEHSSREAGILFTRDPAAYELVVRATGYERP